MTGCSGYIGSLVVYTLLDGQFDVVVLDNFSKGFRQVLLQDITFIEGDAGDQTFIRELLANHSILSGIHFAGSIVMPESVLDPLLLH